MRNKLCNTAGRKAVQENATWQNRVVHCSWIGLIRRESRLASVRNRNAIGQFVPEIPEVSRLVECEYKRGI